MNILLVGALSWNPERVRSLHEHGHRLWGLWSRSMAWDQGPYPMLDDCVTVVGADDAARTIADERIDIVVGLLQVYSHEMWGPPAPGIDTDVWTLLRRLFAARHQGVFDAPIVFQWGFDVHYLDEDVVRALDGHIFCNQEQRVYWTTSTHDGGAGYGCFADGPFVAFLDSDRPKAEFMNDQFAPLLSSGTGEIHTVCVGRPFGIDYAAMARNAIHLHIYGNGVDDTYSTIARDLVTQGATPADIDLACSFLHVHETRQSTGASWPEVRASKSRWVSEFSRYDAGWSYIGRPFHRPLLEDHSAIPNRVSTYLLAGLPVISDRLPGFYRYEELVRMGVNLDLDRGDYGALRASLAAEAQDQARRQRARVARHEYSFDATIPALIAAFEEVRARYDARDATERRRDIPAARRGLRRPPTAPPSPLRAAWRRVRRARAGLASARLARRCRPVEVRLRERLPVVATPEPTDGSRSVTG